MVTDFISETLFRGLFPVDNKFNLWVLIIVFIFSIMIWHKVLEWSTPFISARIGIELCVALLLWMGTPFFCFLEEVFFFYDAVLDVTLFIYYIYALSIYNIKNRK